ncbi:MAG: Co2+/Mg2+ efflux protein ApaG [Bacteroidia bacterium]|nr:Co2+/Mg2+ efflux protein ApaG [Bacteroidia bacterium]
MVSITTHDIRVSVESRFLFERSDPKNNFYFFVYFITIENHSPFTVQLLRRHWEITDSLGEKRMVDGEGVVGETPILEPGKFYTYNSGCDLKSEFGKMRGYYIFKRLFDEKEFLVTIPEFVLEVKGKWN